MSHDKNKLEFELQTTLDDCIGQLEQLVRGLKSGQVLLEKRAEALQLQPSSVVSFALKARQKGSKESIEIELAWRRRDTVAVSSVEPGSISPASPAEEPAR